MLRLTLSVGLEVNCGAVCISNVTMFICTCLEAWGRHCFWVHSKAYPLPLTMSQQLSPHDLYIKWEEGIHEAQLVAQVAWQIFKVELAFANGEHPSSDDAIEVPDDVEDILADIFQACRACVSAFQNPGKSIFLIFVKLRPNSGCLFSYFAVQC